MLTNYSHDRLHEGYEALKRVEAKLKDGTYPLEEAPCFCGADNDRVIKTEDRDGLPHRVVLCQSCALVRANPRPTVEAYYSFYNDEYRDFIYRWLDGTQKNKAEELEAIRLKEHAQGERVLSKLADEDILLPECVIDIGSYQGGMLDAFVDRGVEERWGVEFNDQARLASINRGHWMTSSIDELVEAGVKADLIIMQDVVEHFLDLNDMKKVAQLLKPDGNIYIFTPGMFRTDPSHYFQLAHTWYFVASTFGWVMGKLGFHPSYLDEEICSIYQYTGIPVEVEPPVEWVEYITDEAEGKEERKLPPFRGVCKFTKKLLYDNMRANFSKGVKDIHAISGTEKGAAMIIGGGPSVDGQLEKIIELYDKREGTQVIAIARMYPWCLAHGIIPAYVVSLDCMEEQERGFEEIDNATVHLMSSVTRPQIIDKILEAKAPCYLFDSRDDRKIKNLRRDAGYEVVTVINSGGTVTILSLSVAFNLGFRDIHLFGQDCMFTSEKTHATGIAGESVEQKVLEVTVDGEDIKTTPSFLEFARQTLDLLSAAHNEGMLDSVKVYGDSLISRMWDGKFNDQEAA